MGFIADPEILTMIESDPTAVRPDSLMLRDLVERAVSVKARVVTADLRETTSTGAAVGRELLNYGHTRSRDRASGTLRLAPWRRSQRRHGLRR